MALCVEGLEEGVQFLIEDGTLEGTERKRHLKTRWSAAAAFTGQ